VSDAKDGFPANPYCPVFQQTIELIGRRWTASILRALFSGRERFTDVAQTVPGLSHRLLTERLEELRDAGLVTIEPAIKHGTYRLTPRGEDLRGVFSELEQWNTRWYEPDRQSPAPASA
jgi:DNA-binding HxlR family transcriptional regulator